MTDKDVTPTRRLSTLPELAQETNLLDVTVYEHGGRRIGDVIAVDIDEDAQPAISARVRVQERGIETRFRMVFSCAGFELVHDIGLHYAADDAVEIDQSLISDFLGEVAVMAAYPYLREGIAASAARLGVPVPTLGTLLRGELTFGPDGAENSSDVEAAPAKPADQP